MCHIVQGLDFKMTYSKHELPIIKSVIAGNIIKEIYLKIIKMQPQNDMQTVFSPIMHMKRRL